MTISYLFGTENQYRWRLAKDSDLAAIEQIVSRQRIGHHTTVNNLRFDSDGEGNYHSLHNCPSPETCRLEHVYTAQDYIDVNTFFEDASFHIQRTLVVTDSDTSNVLGMYGFIGNGGLDDNNNKTWDITRTSMGLSPDADQTLGADRWTIGRQFMTALKQQKVYPLKSLWVPTVLDSANSPNRINLSSKKSRQGSKSAKLYDQTKLDEYNYYMIKTNESLWIPNPQWLNQKFESTYSVENFGLLNSLRFIWNTYDSAA